MKKILLVIIALTLSVGMWAEKITLTAADFTVTQNGDWIYDKTEKRVNVELSPEYIKPSADVITIYYNNDRMVKPINPGTYQVYIDMTETDTYAAVTGITSETWKFTIIDPLPEIKEDAIKELEAKKTEANKRMNKEAEGYKQTEEVQWAMQQGDERIMLAKNIAITNIEEATDESTIQKEKDNGLKAMEEETLKTLADIPNAIANYKERMKNEINEIAKDAKNTINELGVYYTVKDQAINEIDKAVAAAEANIDHATSQDDVNTAIDNAQNIINQQLANVQAYYERLQAAKQAAIADINKAAADAEVAINEAAEGCGNIEMVQHVVVTYQGQLRDLKDNAQLSINEETNLDKIGPLKENTIQHIKTEQDKAVEDIQTAIQEFIALQQNAIEEVEQAAATAKEEIDGLGVDESAKSDAKDAIDAIVATTKSGSSDISSDATIV